MSDSVICDGILHGKERACDWLTDDRRLLPGVS